VGLGENDATDAERIVARIAETDAVERFVAGIGTGAAALVLDGAPGIGKSTLWRAGVRLGGRLGHRVLQARPTQTEAAFPFAVLADLLGDAFLSVRAELPGQQERALAAALLVSDEDDPADARTAATGTVSVLRLLADERPVLLAVDDVQWLDPASRRILEFAIRRLPGPVGVFVAVRAEPDDPLPLGLTHALPQERLQRVTLGPLSFGAVRHLIRERIDLSLPRPTLARLVTASGGNPYFALEIARVLAHDAAPTPLHEPPPLPSTLRELVASRIDALSVQAREAALIVAASPEARVTTLRRTMTSASEADGALAEAEAAGVMTVDGDRVRFAHPLLASAAYETASADRRRALHRRLASVAEDPETRGVHLALGVLEADAETADAIEEAAHRAALRGAHDAAAGLFEAARRATPGDHSHALARRFLGGALALNAVGEFSAARALAEDALVLAADAAQRAEALVLLAGLDWFDGAAATATGRVEQALDAVAGDVRRQAPIYAKFVRFNFAHDIQRAVGYADAALALLDGEQEPAALAHVLIDRFFAGALRGEPVERELLARGIALEEQAWPDLRDGPQPMPLIWCHCADEIEAARRRYAWEEGWYRERGEELSLADRWSHLAVAELRAGAWEEAERLVDASCAVAEHLEVRGPRAMMFEKHALIDAHRGRVEPARRTLLPLAEAYEQAGQSWWAALTLSTLAFAHRTAGADDEADAALARMHEHARAIGAGDVLFDRSEPYQIDSLLERSQLEQAQSVLTRLEERGRTLPRPWIAAVLPAARALVAAARGDPAGALALLDKREAGGSTPPFETAWSLYVEGRLRRRSKQKRAAAASLEHAADLFDRVGAPTWAARARGELDRVGLRHSPPDELTASESRVAELAASGLTNREIAQAAFMSIKTVEANLARVYRKLGIHSRAELGARMTRERAGTDGQT
jgi:DNA-binding CsgD family transcriptional regulator